ncbi:50S ribosomal protein L16 [Candidatus Dependentiae bacterium]
MLMPKKVKYRKQQRGSRKGRSKGARELAFGEYGIQAVESCWLSAQQIEAMRVTVSRRTKKFGKMFLRVFPDKPITKKPAETRMGKGKGNVDRWVAVVKRERIIFELKGVSEEVAREICKAASHKLPLKVKFVKREQQA